MESGSYRIAGKEIRRRYILIVDIYCQVNVFMSWTIIRISNMQTESLGPEYGEMQILDLEVTWSESEPRTPLVCILSIGSDPTSQIATLAKNKNIGKLIIKKYFLPVSLSNVFLVLSSSSSSSIHSFEISVDGTRTGVYRT